MKFALKEENMLNNLKLHFKYFNIDIIMIGGADKGPGAQGPRREGLQQWPDPGIGAPAPSRGPLWHRPLQLYVVPTWPNS